MEQNNYNQFLQSFASARHNTAMQHMAQTGVIKFPHQFTEEEVSKIAHKIADECWSLSDEESARNEQKEFEQDLNHGVSECDSIDCGNK